jgi:hypothetical protein
MGQSDRTHRIQDVKAEFCPPRILSVHAARGAGEKLPDVGGEEASRRGLQLHAVEIPHDDSHLSPLRSLSQKRGLVEEVLRLGSRPARSVPTRLVLEAAVALHLRHLWLGPLRLGLVVHRTKQVLRGL